MSSDSELGSDLAAKIAAQRPARSEIKTAGQAMKPFQERLERIVVSPEREAAAAARLAEQKARARQQRCSGRWKEFLKSCGTAYQHCDLSNYVCVSDKQEATVDAVRRYVEDFATHFAKGVGLTLLGPVGTGKDHLATAVCRRAIWEHDQAVLHVSGVRLYRQLRDAVGERSNKTSPDLIERLIRTPILYLSDPVPSSDQLTAFLIQTVTEVFDERYRNLRPTIVTANLAGASEIEQKLTPAIADRMRDRSFTIICNWASHRAANRPQLAEV